MNLERKIMADKTYNWAKSFEKEGFSIFNEQSVKLLRAIQVKYGDYISFFHQLEKLFVGQKVTTENEKAAQTLAMLEDASTQIDMLLDGKTQFSKAVVDNLFKSITTIDVNVQYFAGKGDLEITKATQKRIEEAEKKTGVGIDRLSKSSVMISSKMKTMGASKFQRLLKTPLGSTALSGMKDIGRGIRSSVLGPLGGIANKGISLGGSIKQSKELAGNKAMTDAVSLENESSIEQQQGMFNNIFGSKKKKSSEGGSGGGGEASAGASASLFSFFQFDAYKAKWTSDLMDAVKGGKGGGKVPLAEKADMGLKGILDMLKGFAPTLMKVASILGPALAIAGAAFAGWKIGEFLGDKLGINKALQKGVVDRHNKKNLSNFAEQSENPTMKRALELQSKNPKLTTKEAVDMANGELNNNSSKKPPSTNLGKVEGGLNSVPPNTSPNIDLGKIVVNKSGLTPEQIKNKEKYMNSPEELKLAEERDRLKATSEYKKAGIEVNAGLPVMNDLTSEQKSLVNKTESKMNEAKMERENEAAKYQSEMNESLKKIANATTKSGGGGNSSGNFHATTIGDPFLESLSMGSLDVE